MQLVNIKVASTKPTTLKVAGAPIASFPIGVTSTRIRVPDGELELSGDKDAFVEITTRDLQSGETVDDLPPPEPVQPSNYLAKMRNAFRQQLGVTRESFLERDVDLPGYEIEEEEVMFEEEQAELEKVSQKMKEEEEKALTHEEDQNINEVQGKKGESSASNQRSDTDGSSTQPDNG